MPKLSIFKSTADGEQVNVEVDLTQDHVREMQPRIIKERHPDGRTIEKIIPGKSVREIFSYLFDFVDQRLFEVNLRIMTAQAMVKKLPVEAQMAFHAVMQTLHSRNVAPEFYDMQREVASEIIQKLIEKGYDQDKVVEAAKRVVPSLQDGQPAAKVEAPE